MRKFLPTLFFLLVGICLSAQPTNPETDAVFRTGELATIKLTLTPEDKAFLIDPANAESETYLPAIFHMTNSQMDTILEKNVGVRLRGNTSRYHDKKPFKIDFREFDGKKFFGYKKFNLKPNVNDPSQVREPLTLLYYREMDVPAARTHPLRLYMNDEYMGVYLNVEQIDDEFLNLRYGHEEGFLYKCGYGANLVDNGQVFNPVVFESELNEDIDTRAELDHFIDVLNNTNDANFSTAIEGVFNVDLYLRQLAVEALLGHWDGYSYNQNNFYLFYNGQSGKVEFIPYDVDNTWGIDWVGKDWGLRDLKVWAKTDELRPLTKRILNVRAYCEKYKEYLETLIGLYFNETYLNPIIQSYETILTDAVEADLFFDNSFGFTHADFTNSFSEGMDNHVKYGITEYLEARTQSALEQLPKLITASEKEQPDAPNQIYPNPSLHSKTYFYSSKGIFNAPIVYTSNGMPLTVNMSQVDDQRWEISLPAQAPQGLYLIHVNNKVFRWVYK